MLTLLLSFVVADTADTAVLISYCLENYYCFNVCITEEFIPCNRFFLFRTILKFKKKLNK